MIRILCVTLLLMADATAQTAGRVTIIYTNNNNGNLIECDCEGRPWGGLARRKSIIDGIRAEGVPVLLFDSGDFLYQFGDLQEQDKMVVQIYEKMNYDAVTLGDNDVVNGATFLSDFILKSRLPLVSATLTDKNGKQLLPNYLIVERDGKKFGVIGYTPASSFRFFPEGKENPVAVQDEQSAIKKSLKNIKGLVDYIIVLSHSGDDVDMDLAKAHPEIDLIVGGHNQVETEKPVRIGKTTIVQAGGNGHLVGKLELRLDKGKLTPLGNSLIPLLPTVAKDPVFKSMIESIKKTGGH